jgi:ribosomal-protein-alanine N-acetyltransferase
VVVNSGTKLRAVRAEDLRGIARLERQIFKIEGAWSLAEYEEDYAKANRVYVCAEGDGELIGYAFAEWRGSTGYIRALAVRRGWRGERIGARMLDRVCASLWRRGMQRLVLHVREENERAVELYRRRGFVRRRRVLNYYRDGVHALEMVRVRRGR